MLRSQSTICLFLLLIATLSFSLQHNTTLYADSLSIIEEQVAKEAKRTIHKENEELYGAKWFVPGSNYAKIFIYKEGGLLLQEWVGGIVPGFNGAKPHAQRKTEYVSSTRTFYYVRDNSVQLTIYAPHPKYVPMVKLGVVTAFTQLVPSPTMLSGTRPFTARAEGKGMLYLYEKGGCSALIELSKEVRVQLVDIKCPHSDKLLELAKALDLERLTSKLGS